MRRSSPVPAAIRNAVKAWAGGAFAACGGFRRAGGLGVVFTFHRVLPDDAPVAGPMANLAVRQGDFRAFLAETAARAVPLPLDEALLGDAAPADKPWFAVTFDDGWRDNFLHAFPVLEKLGIPATVFLATGAVEERRPFWWQGLDALGGDVEAAKALPAAERARAAGEAFARTGTERFRDDFLSWADIAEMEAGGLVRFGAHSHGHGILPSLGAAEAEADLARNLALLRGKLSRPASRFFAWPDGQADARLVPALRAAGFAGAVATVPGCVLPGGGEWREIPRVNVDRAVASTRSLRRWAFAKALL
ncbi:MAG: polysaccharide deacetylase family protein [Kiritimatiellae bacterium]|nr:polysaccharide deacetylase family protein [Kiritimatiellia bacterium]